MGQTEIRSTTIVGVRRDGRVAIAGDGQVTLGNTSIKHGARKVIRLHEGQALAGYAGTAADALALIDKFEGHLKEARGNLERAAVEFAKEWRTDRILRRLEALLLVANRDLLLVLSGSGDVIRPDEDAVGIGSGGAFAHAAALALLRHTQMPADAIAREALSIAGQLCIYTNDQIVLETL
jgi:ATP-dependent HslUV protease subunit HslV